MKIETAEQLDALPTDAVIKISYKGRCAAFATKKPSGFWKLDKYTSASRTSAKIMSDALDVRALPADPDQPIGAKADESGWRKFDLKDKSTWPPDGKMVLAYHKDSAVLEHSLQVLRSNKWHPGYDEDSLITHWMPLPEPPEL